MRGRCFFFGSRVLLLASGVWIAACEKQGGPSPEAQVDGLRQQAELDRTKKKLASAEKALAANSDALVLAKSETEAAKKEVADKGAAIADREGQIRALQTQLADLKKRDAFVFAETSKLVQQGLTTTALDHYRQFVKDFPKSPLVADANRAIAELGVVAPREAKARAVAIDPKAPERDLLKKFAAGDVTPQELAPLLKDKSIVEVLRLLGAPNQTFRDGADLGYVDKITDPATGERGTLVISFDEEKVVSTLRVGYAGRPIRP